MASVYLDTSALLKLYIDEEGTAPVVRAAEGSDTHHVVILDITRVESRSAVRRRERAGDIPGADASGILSRIEQDVSSFFLVQPSSSAVIEEAGRLVDRYPLRALDALQLAGSLVFQRGAPGPVTFVCADAPLCQAAESEQLATLNPLG